MNEHERSHLTPDGEARREAMLDELVGAMQRVHHGRRVRRRVASALAVLTIFAGIAWVIGSQSLFGDRAQPQFVHDQGQQPVPDAPTTERLIQMVDDDELVALLALGSVVSTVIILVDELMLVPALSFTVTLKLCTPSSKITVKFV